MLDFAAKVVFLLMPMHALPEQETSTMTDFFGDSLPMGAVARLGSQRFRVRPPVSSLALSPDGRVLAVAAEQGVVLLDYETGKVLSKSKHPDFSCGEVVFSPKGDLVFALYPGFIQVRSLAKNDVVHEIKLPTPTGLNSMAIDPAGEFLACLSIRENANDRLRSDALLTLWRLKNFEKWKTVAFEKSHSYGTSLAFSPDGQFVVVGGDRRGVIPVVDVKNDAAVSLRWQAHTDTVSHVAFSPDGKLVASIDKFGLARIWGFTDKKMTQSFQAHSGRYARTYNVRFSDDGKTLISHADNALRLWTLEGKQIGDTVRASVSALISDSSDKQLLIYNDFGEIRFFDLAQGRERPRFSSLGPITGLSFQDNETIWLSDFRGYVGLSSWKTGKTETHLSGFAIAHSKDRALLAAGGDGVIVVHDVKTRKEVCQLKAKGRIWDMSFSADGKFLVVSEQVEADVVQVYDLALRKRIAEYPGLQGHLSPDGTQLAVSGRNKETDDAFLAVYETKTRKLVKRWQFTETRVWPMFSGEMLLVGRSDGVIEMWETTKPFKKLKEIEGKSGAVLAVSPDGTLLAAGGFDSVVRIWDMKTSALVSEFKGHTGAVNNVTFSPDGRLLASAGEDTTVLIWKLDFLKKR
jgi:WD40 repeat protein